MRALALAMLLLPAMAIVGVDGGSGRLGAQTGAPLHLALTADRPSYAPGQPVALTLAVENAGAAPVAVTAPTAQRYDFAVLRDGREIWRWSADRAFPAQVTEWTIGPGERREFSETWRPASAQPPGDYTAVATLAGGQSLGTGPTRLTFSIR